MTISELTRIINDQLDGLTVKAIYNTDGSTPKSTKELFIPAPIPGYAGDGKTEDDRKFVWQIIREGKSDWRFSSSAVDS